MANFSDNKPNNNTTEKINGYISGTMNLKEAVDFKEQLKRDEQLQEKVSEVAIEVYGRSEFKKKLQHIGKNYQGNKDLKLKYIYRIAAAVLVLIIPSGIFWHYYTLPSDLYVAYYEPYPMLMGDRGEPDSDKLINTVVNMYQNKDYEQLITLLSSEETALELGEYTFLNFYLALAYLSVEPARPDYAIPHLIEVMEHHSELKQQAVWYIGLAYYKSNDQENAIKIFKSIALDQQHYKNKTANQILTKYFDSYK